MSPSSLRGALAAAVIARAAWTAPASAAPVHQLWFYEVFEGQEAAFHTRFRDHAARIMKRHDFKILAMWEAKTGSKTECVYLLEWPNRDVIAERWAGFMADKEWSNIEAKGREEHGPLMGAIQDRTLIMTPYSPTLAKCSQDTALRDIDGLVQAGVLTKDQAGGRSTSYSLSDWPPVVS